LRRDFLLTPITGLAFLDTTDGASYVLAGEDTELKVYDVHSNRLCCQLGVFAAQPIHGIHVGSGGRILIWGGQSVTVILSQTVQELLEDHESPCILPTVHEVKAPDWIYDGAVSPHDPNTSVLVTAHNEALELYYDEDRESVRFGRIVSPSRPILYSSNLTWLSKDRVLIAGGTVFGEIVVWECHIYADEQRPTTCELLFIFSGHEGSIFGVHISPEIDLDDGLKTRLLASCSDDRTIRIWDISSTAGETGNRDILHNKFKEARETGFGNNADLVTTKSSKDSAGPLAVAMGGHISRIWHVKFPCRISAAEASNMPIYSFGEDATIIKWNLEIDSIHWRDLLDRSGSTANLGALTHQSTLPCHDGKHIWSTAMTLTADDCTLIATGGADGKISLIDALQMPQNKLKLSAAAVQSPSSQLLTFTSKDIMETIPHTEPSSNTTGKSRDILQRFAFISRNEILGTSTSGGLLLGTFDGDTIKWSNILLDGDTRTRLKSCSVVRSYGNGIAYIGTSTGHLYIFEKSLSLKEIKSFPGKISNIFTMDQPTPTSLEFADQDPAATPLKIALMITFLGTSEFSIVSNSPSSGMVISVAHIVDMDPRFVFTAAKTCGDYFIVGSRHGYIAIYKSLGGTKLTDIVHTERCAVDAITGIVPLPSKSPNSPQYFLTTSRDGKYRIFEIQATGKGKISLQVRHETSPSPFGPNIEGVWFIQNQQREQELILCGFRSSYFIVWNESRRSEVAHVDCGGAHRNFAYISNPTSPDWVRFAFTKASNTSIFSQICTPLRKLNPGGHGREVRTVSCCGNRIATGSEDTSIRIWEFEDNEKNPLGREMRCTAVMKVHTTGIQCLRWHGEDYLFSSSGNEDFLVWRVNRLLTEYTGVAVLCEAALPDRTPDGDLRITDFDVIDLEETQVGSGSGDEITKVLCISMAFSNSVLKTYRYTKSSGFRILAQGQYTGACLTHIRHLSIKQGVATILTASTDGHLAIWTATISPSSTTGLAGYKLVSATQLHQSSIKALEVAATGTGGMLRHLVVTGGDDNALGVTILETSENSDEPQQPPNVIVKNKSIVRRAHAAAINAVAILDHSQDDGNAVVATASNDQRLKIWGASGRDVAAGKGIPISLLEDRYSGVADAGALEVLDTNMSKRLLLAGVGLEIWSGVV
jgi:WD repeat-containing protein 6